jgi:hypothetical protein
MANALNSLLMVRAGANAYFRLTNRSKLPPNRAVVHFLDKNKKPTGIVAVYEFVQPGSEDPRENELMYLEQEHTPARAIVLHARELKMVTQLVAGELIAYAKVSFFGKALPTSDRKWKSVVFALAGEDCLKPTTESRS